MAYEKSIVPPCILPHCGLTLKKPAARPSIWHIFRKAKRLSIIHPKRSSYLFNLLLFFILSIISWKINAQETITVSWPLTSSGEASFSHPSGFSGFSAGPAVERVIFEPGYGAMSRGWDTETLNPEAYYEYRVAPAEGHRLSFYLLRLDISLGSGEMLTTVRYSTDSFRSEDHQAGQPRFFYTTIPQTLTLGLDAGVTYPDTLSIRVYAWNASSRQVDFNNRNVTLEGTLYKKSPPPISYDGPMSPLGSTSFTAPGAFSWTCPAGVTCVKVECVGGGGRGGELNPGGPPAAHTRGQ